MIGARATLIGYGPSVYTRAVRMAASYHAIAYDWQSLNPFDTSAGPHPFSRVPVWRHCDFTLYETAAILTYLEAFADAEAQSPRMKARVQQVVGIADAYAYWPLVRQVYAQGVFLPEEGEPSDAAEIAQGLSAAPKALAALDDIAAEGLVLNGQNWTRADWHLAPMIAVFNMYDPARKLLDTYRALRNWFAAVSDTPAFQDTKDAPS